MNKVKLVIMCGIPFAGKTVLAKKLEKDLGFVRVDLDEVTFELMGSEVKDGDIDQAGWDKIYQEMYRRIEELLKEGKGVVHDTGNFTVYERGLISDIAKKVGAGLVTVFLDVPVEVARERMQKNRETGERSDVTDKAFDEAVAEMEKPLEQENPLVYNNENKYQDLLEQLKG